MSTRQHIIDTSDALSRGMSLGLASRRQQMDEQQYRDNQKQRERDNQRQDEADSRASTEFSNRQADRERGLAQEDAASSTLDGMAEREGMFQTQKYDGDMMGPPQTVPDDGFRKSFMGADPRTKMGLMDRQYNRGRQAVSDGYAASDQRMQEEQHKARMESLARTLDSDKAFKQAYWSSMVEDGHINGTDPSMAALWESMDGRSAAEFSNMMAKRSQATKERQGLINAATQEVAAMEELRRKMGGSLTETQNVRYETAKANLAAAQAGASPSLRDYLNDLAHMRTQSQRPLSAGLDRKNMMAAVNAHPAVKAAFAKMTKTFGNPMADDKEKATAQAEYTGTAQRILDEMEAGPGEGGATGGDAMGAERTPEPVTAIDPGTARLVGYKIPGKPSDQAPLGTTADGRPIGTFFEDQESDTIKARMPDGREVTYNQQMADRAHDASRARVTDYLKLDWNKISPVGKEAIFLQQLDRLLKEDADKQSSEAEAKRRAELEPATKAAMNKAWEKYRGPM